MHNPIGRNNMKKLLMSMHVKLKKRSMHGSIISVSETKSLISKSNPLKWSATNVENQINID